MREEKTSLQRMAETLQGRIFIAGWLLVSVSIIIIGCCLKSPGLAFVGLFGGLMLFCDSDGSGMS